MKYSLIKLAQFYFSELCLKQVIHVKNDVTVKKVNTIGYLKA